MGWGIFRWTGLTKKFRPEFLQRHFGRAQDLQKIYTRISPTTFWTGWGIFRWTGLTKNFRPECLQRHFGRAGEYSVGQDSQIILDQNFSNDLLPNISSHHFCAHKLRLPEFTKWYILAFPLRSSHHFRAHKLRLPNITKAYLLTSLPTPETSPTALQTTI